MYKNGHLYITYTYGLQVMGRPWEKVPLVFYVLASLFFFVITQQRAGKLERFFFTENKTVPKFINIYDKGIIHAGLV